MSYLGNGPADAIATSSQIADGAVTTPKLATGAVTNVKVSAGTLMGAAVNANASIALTKIGDNATLAKNDTNNSWVKAQAGYTVSSSETGAFTFDYDTYQNFM